MRFTQEIFFVLMFIAGISMIVYDLIKARNAAPAPAHKNLRSARPSVVEFGAKAFRYDPSPRE